MAEKKAGSVKRAAAKKSVNAANLETLGPARLAAMLIAVAGDYPAIKRLLKLELSGEVGAEALSAEIGKRLDLIEQSRTRVHWRRYKEFVRDLDLHRNAIAGRLVELDPAEALALIVRFVAAHARLADRVNDSKGEVEAVFDAAVADATRIAPLAKPIDFRPISDQLFDLLDRGTFGLAIQLLRGVAPALPLAVLTDLRDQVEITMAGRPRANNGMKLAAQILADAQGDVDGYIAYFTPSQAVLPPIGARIARRLLAAGRIDEAKAALERSRPEAPPAPGKTPAKPADDGDWELVQIEVLEAQGDAAGAQAARWARFEATLSAAPLREYLKRLPDFDDVEAEDRAIDYARGHRDLYAALSFFLAWPALEQAAELVLERREQLSGQDPELLGAAAKALEARHPAAATLLLRAMIWDTARYARTDYYKDAQRQLLEAESLAPAIEGGALESHDEFARRIAQFRRW